MIRSLVITDLSQLWPSLHYTRTTRLDVWEAALLRSQFIHWPPSDKKHQEVINILSKTRIKAGETKAGPQGGPVSPYFIWWRCRDLNPGRYGYEPYALTS